MTPGIQARSVSRMLTKTSLSHAPFSEKTPSGGRMTAKMNLKMSLQVRAMLSRGQLNCVKVCPPVKSDRADLLTSMSERIAVGQKA